jgi:RNA polymerase sigma-70 factor (ECF subfamily)
MGTEETMDISVTTFEQPIHMDSSRTLLERARQWDEAALAQVYDEYAPAIYRYVYRRTGHQETAQDIVSQTFQRFLDSLKHGGGPKSHLSGWLYRVAHNLVVDFYRRQPADPPAALDDAPQPTVPPNSEEAVVHQEEMTRVRKALQSLTPLQQQVIVLRFLEEMSLKEVAHVLERTVGAVKGLQYRGLQNLQHILQEDNA